MGNAIAHQRRTGTVQGPQRAGLVHGGILDLGSRGVGDDEAVRTLPAHDLGVGDAQPQRHRIHHARRGQPLQHLRRHRRARADFELSRRDLGYGLLLKRYVADPRTADKATIEKAAWDTVPNVPVMFWVFRIMAGIGFLQIAVFGAAFVLVTLRKCDTKWILWTAVAIMPLPWIAAESGWLLAELRAMGNGHHPGVAVSHHADTDALAAEPGREFGY